MTTTLGFDLPLYDDRGPIVAPVKAVRRSTGEVVRGMSYETLDVAPGSYLVSCELPAGQLLSTIVAVGDGDAAKALLEPAVGERSPHEWQARAHYHVAPRVRGPISKGFGPRLDVELTFIARQHALGSFAPPSTVSGGEGFVSLELDVGSGDGDLVAVLRERPEDRIQALVVPRGQSVRLVALAEAGGVRLELQLADPEVDMLLRSAARADHEGTSMLAQRVAEKALAAKLSDPIGAAIGAATLLRFNELERLRDWPQNLMSWIDWLPDGAALHGEHMARLGDHTEALAAFLQVGQRGIPFLGDSIQYTVTRLREYRRSGLADASVDALLERIQAIAYDMMFDRPISTFGGVAAIHAYLGSLMGSVGASGGAIQLGSLLESDGYASVFP